MVTVLENKKLKYHLSSILSYFQVCMAFRPKCLLLKREIFHQGTQREPKRFFAGAS
jgi:hypothetical protein